MQIKPEQIDLLVKHFDDKAKILDYIKDSASTEPGIVGRAGGFFTRFGKAFNEAAQKK